MVQRKSNRHGWKFWAWEITDRTRKTGKRVGGMWKPPKSDTTLGLGVSKAYVWTGWKRDGAERAVPERGGGGSQIQSSNVCPPHQSHPSAFIPLKAPVCSMCPLPEGEQDCSLCFPYYVRDWSPCRQLSVCALGVRFESRAVCSCATGKFAVEEEYLDIGCEVGRLSRSCGGNDWAQCREYETNSLHLWHVSILLPGGV